MKNIFLAMTGAFLILTGIAACGGYYKVVDPATDKIYYTDDLDQEKGGAVVLKDANTGSTVTLQSSEVTRINKEAFKANTKKE